jgi:hypothetical protein
VKVGDDEVAQFDIVMGKTFAEVVEEKFLERLGVEIFARGEFGLVGGG